MSAIDIPMFVVDAHLTVTFANDAAKSLTMNMGMLEDQGDVEGRPLFEAVPLLSESVRERYKILFATGEPQQDETVYQVGDKSVGIQSHRYPIFSGPEVTHAVVIVRDISEFRAAQEALKQSEATARAIIDSSFESIILVDRDGTIITANETAARRLGRPLKDLVGKTSHDVLSPDIWHRRQPWIESVFRTGKSARHTDSRDGMVFDYTMNPVLEDTGAVSHIAVFATEVTSSMKAQEELTRIRQAVESSSDAIAMADVAGRHVFSNRAFEQLFEYSVKELNEAGGPEAAYRDRSVARELFDAIKGGKSWSGTVDMVTRTGRDLVIALRADAIRDGEGKLIGLIGIHTDVTAQRLADEQLKRSEERFRLQFRSIPVPTFIWEKDGEDFVLKEYNLSAESLTRGGVAHSIGRRATEMYNNRPDIVADLRECLETGSVVFREMSYQYHSIPSERFLSVHYVPIPPNLIMVHTIDLTDRRRAQAALQSAHNELEKKVQERTEALRKQIEFDSLVRRLLTRFANCPEAEIDEQVRRSLREVAEFTETDSAYTVLVSPELTHYAVAHSWVRDELPDYAPLYQNVPMGSNVWLEKKILGAEEVHLGTLDDFPQEAAKDRSAFEREGVKSAILMPLRGQGGSIKGAIGVRSYRRAIKWESEQLGWIRTVADAVANVLERKQIEEARRAEQEKAELYFQTAEVMLVALDLNGSITRINRKGCNILGYEEQELVGRNWFDTCIRAEDRYTIEGAFKRLLSSRASEYETFENAVIAKSGMVRLIGWRNSLLYDKRGKVIGLLSSGEDITDRRRAEAELDRTYERLQVEQQALHQKNVALQEMVEQIQEGRRTTAAQIQTNLERIVLPVIERIGARLDPQGREYLDLVRGSLSDILSPFASNLENQFKRLSPREIEICELIRRGYDSKKIADLRSSSVQTVLKQRKAIRRKLGLDRKKINLATYLTSTFPATKKRERRKNII